MKEKGVRVRSDVSFSGKGAATETSLETPDIKEDKTVR